MKLSEFINNLLKVQKECDALGIDPPVFSCHGASGATDELSNAYIREIDGNEDMGPFDMEVGQKWLEIYAGN